MATKRKQDRGEELRRDHDFRALVKLLDEQTPEQIEFVYDRYERSEQEEWEERYEQ